MNYVDGFVAAVPTANREKYREHAEKAAAVFKEHGARTVVECWGDDVPEGKVTSFRAFKKTCPSYVQGPTKFSAARIQVASDEKRAGDCGPRS